MLTDTEKEELGLKDYQPMQDTELKPMLRLLLMALEEYVLSDEKDPLANTGEDTIVTTRRDGTHEIWTLVDEKKIIVRTHSFVSGLDMVAVAASGEIFLYQKPRPANAPEA